MNSKTHLPTTLIRKKDNYTLSVYKGELSKEVVTKETLKLKVAFPSLEKGFYEVFFDRLKDNGFCNERLHDAVNHVIDNFKYPKPNIAEIISFDKNIELLGYSDMLKMRDQFEGAFKMYRPVRIDDATVPMYASVNDIEKYNLKLWNSDEEKK